MSQVKSDQQIGLWMSTSLVVGNMIGAGVFLLPSALAEYGGISFFGWLITGVGALAFAFVYSRLSKIIKGVSGGPYIYARDGLGDFAGFLVAWGYWVSTWATNAAIAVGFVGYLGVFIPYLSNHSFASMITGLSAIWFLSWINSRGIRSAGKMQLATTILKITPLILVSIAGLFYLNFDHFTPLNLSEVSPISAIAASTTLTLFACLGIECAAIPAKNVRDPETNIPKATIYGTVISVIVYIIGSMSVMGIIPPETLATSNAPFADAAAIMWGETGRYLVAGGAVVSTFGALNGWILIQGQIPDAIAKDKLFPKIFAKENKKGAPVMGIAIGSIFASVLMMMNFTKGLVGTFKFFILLSTLTVLVPYLFSAASLVTISIAKKLRANLTFSKLIMPILAFLFSMWAIVGSGQEIVYWGFVLLMSGVPLYVWIKYNQAK